MFDLCVDIEVGLHRERFTVMREAQIRRILDCALCLEACPASMMAAASVRIRRGSRRRRGTALRPSARRFGRLALRRSGSGPWARTRSLSLRCLQHAVVSDGLGREDSKHSGHCDDARWRVVLAAEDAHARLRYQLLLREMHKTLDDVFYISDGVIHLYGGTFIV